MSDRHSIIPAIWVFVTNDAGNVLLIRRSNTGWKDGWYTLPAGHVEQGESPSACAARELKEEVGLDVEQKDLELVHTVSYVADDKTHERVSFFFKATNYSGEAFNAEPHKADDLIWADPKQLPEMLIPILRHAFGQVEQAIHYSEINYPESEVTL